MGIAAVGSLPFNKSFTVLARLGYAASSIKTSQTTNVSDLTFGVGAQYNVNNTFGVRLSYDLFKVGTNPSVDSSMFTIAAVVKL